MSRKRDVNLENYILLRIRGNSKNPTQEIRIIEEELGFKISPLLLPEKSFFWWEPKWVLTVYYKEEGVVIYVRSGIIYRWRFARRDEISKYTPQKPAP